jgi:hypothetical protein
VSVWQFDRDIAYCDNIIFWCVFVNDNDEQIVDLLFFWSQCLTGSRLFSCFD